MKFLVALILVLVALLGLIWLAGPSLLRSADDMNDPRSEVHAAEMNGVIYVTGGIGFFRTLASCAAFDTVQEQFSDCPDLPRKLHHVAMAAGEGRVFASGGYASLPFNIDPDGALFVLNPADDEPRWEELSPLPEPLGQHAMLYRDGALYLVGGDRNGETSGALTRYDLASGEWEEMSPMPTPRHSHAIALEGERLYVTGGRSPTLGGQSRVIEVYDFASNSWESLPDAPFDLGGHGAAVLDGRLHVFGGEDLRSSVVVQQHAVLDTNDLEAGWQMAKDIALPRHGFATARVGDTAWILAGGKRAGIRTPWSVTGTAFPVPLRGTTHNSARISE